MSWYDGWAIEEGVVTDEVVGTGSATVFGLPRSHWHCQLDNFAWPRVRPVGLREHIERFLAQVEEGGSPHLVLLGPPGVGKTHLGVAAYRWAVVRVGTLLATWVNVPAFCERVKAGYAHDPDPFPDYQAATRLVVMDDLFGRELTAHEAGHIVYRMLDVAYQNGAALLVTMNQTLTDLEARLPPHERSRLLSQPTVIAMSAERDWRLA